MNRSTKKGKVSITFNHDKIASELSKDTAYKWVIEKGLSYPKMGNRMIDFLELLGVITIKKEK